MLKKYILHDNNIKKFLGCSESNFVFHAEMLLSLVSLHYSCFHLYGYWLLHIPTRFSPFFFRPVSPFVHFLSARGLPRPLENVIAAILPYATSHLHEGTGKLRKICADTVDHLTESVPSLKSLRKHDLLLSVSICRPRTDEHPSTYWPKAKLLDFGDRLVPDTYDTPIAVSCFSIFNATSNRKTISFLDIYNKMVHK